MNAAQDKDIDNYSLNLVKYRYISNTRTIFCRIKQK